MQQGHLRERHVHVAEVQAGRLPAALLEHHVGLQKRRQVTCLIELLLGKQMQRMQVLDAATPFPRIRHGRGGQDQATRAAAKIEKFGVCPTSTLACRGVAGCAIHELSEERQRELAICEFLRRLLLRVCCL